MQLGFGSAWCRQFEWCLSTLTPNLLSVLSYGRTEISLSAGTDKDDFGPRPISRAEPRPRLHQLPTLLKQVAPAVRSLHLAFDRVGQGHFDHLAREIRAL